MNKNIVMPSWVKIGAECRAMSYYSGSGPGEAWSEGGYKFKITRIMKTQVEVQAEVKRSADRVEIVTKKYKLKERMMRNGRTSYLEAMDDGKYNPGVLWPEGGKDILALRSRRALTQNFRLHQEICSTFVGKSSRWAGNNDIHELYEKLRAATAARLELDQERDRVEKMKEDEIRAR